MKRVITYLHGEHKKIRTAADISEAERYAYDFRCLDESCGAEFHLRRRAWPLETTKEVAATFARNPSSPHKPGCDYDYESKASRSAGAAFCKDDRLHLRINFPLGSSYSDLHPERGRLTMTQRLAARNNAGNKSVGTVAGLVKYLERAFGGLENPALENLVLHYQGRDYQWPDVFTSSRDYRRIFNAAADQEQDVTKGLVCVVKPEFETSASRKGKRRFSCAELPVTVNGVNTKLRPVITCETGALAQSIETGKTMLLTARPFIPPALFKNGSLNAQGSVPVYLHVAEPAQMTALDEKYWNPAPGMQIALF